MTTDAGADQITSRSRLVGVTSLFFVLLQSACTAVMAISGVRVVLGLGALAAAAGVHEAPRGFHSDAIRIPMLAFAVIGSLLNLYVLWRMRSLRARPSSQWRITPVTARQKRGERLQAMLAAISLTLVVAEWVTHRMIHHNGL